MGKKESEAEKYERWLATTTPEERAKLSKEGIEIAVPGERVSREVKSQAEMQAIRLGRLMERFDVPLEEEEDKGDIYQAPYRKRHLQQGQTVQKDEFHAVYRLSRKKEVAKSKMLEMVAKENVKRELYDEAVAEQKAKEDRDTAKRRAKRHRRNNDKVTKK